MKICFSSRHVYDEASKKLYLELSKIGKIEATFIVNNNAERDNIKGSIPNACIVNISELVEQNWETAKKEKLESFEKKYQMSPIWRYIYTDRFFPNHDYSYTVTMVKAFFIAYQTVFEKEYDFYYDETIATMQSYIAYFVGKANGTKYISQMVARGFDTTHHYFLTDPFQHIDGFDSNWRNKQYSDEVVSKATFFLQDFRKKKMNPGLMSNVKSKPNLGLGAFLVGIKRSWSKLYNNKYDYINYHSYVDLLKKPFYLFRYIRYKHFFSVPDLSCRYIYYPLHYEPEAATLVCAEKYEKQLFYIDSIAKSLKAGEYLYVKEHYALIGHRPVQFYKQLSKYNNVIVIDPTVNSLGLITNAYAVTTLTGTAGWEAMLLKKPVILGGNIYFDNAPGVKKVNDAYDEFRDCLDTQSTIDDSEIIKYLCEYLSNIYEGCVYFSVPKYLAEENICKVARSLFDKMKQMKGIVDETQIQS